MKRALILFFCISFMTFLSIQSSEQSVQSHAFDNRIELWEQPINPDKVYKGNWTTCWQKGHDDFHYALGLKRKINGSAESSEFLYFFSINNRQELEVLFTNPDNIYKVQGKDEKSYFCTIVSCEWFPPVTLYNDLPPDNIVAKYRPAPPQKRSNKGSLLVHKYAQTLGLLMVCVIIWKCCFCAER